MRRDLRKKFLSALSATCTVTLLMSTSVTALANGEVRVDAEVTDVKATVYPIPQDMKYISSEGMKFEGTVNVVLKGKHEVATLEKIKEILSENNIDYSISDEVIDGVANIIISSEKEKLDEYGVSDENKVLDKKEAYVLKATNDENTKGNISIIGSDEDGAYYGVLTLGQILEQSNSDGKFAEVNVSDYPEIEFRGFIEGFYGTPWSHEDRLGLMKDTSNFKMNTYIYAPKDDIYHRASWKELYPADKANEIAELAKVGKENNFNFCWTIHPGATLKFTEADYEAVINKFEQLYSLGVRQFGVLFDDTDDWSNGRKQAEWINKIDNEFIKVKGDVAPMIVISARYNSAWGPSINNYFKPFMQTLNKDIQVMWTGHATMSNVSKSVFEWPKVQTGVNKDVAVWWNYPVNDYCDSRVLMAPLHNLNKDLDNVSGFFSNPMNQAEASKVALYSIADYTWNTDEFDFMNSWETAIEKLVPEVKDDFMKFASNTSYLKDDGGASGAFEYDESWYLADKIDSLKNDIINKSDVTESAKALLDEFNTMVSGYNNIKSKTNNANLLKELDPFLGAYNALGEAGAAAMESLISAQEGSIEKWIDNTSIAEEKLASMDNFKVERLKDGAIKEYVVSVGTKLLKQLVKDTIRESKAIISKSILVDYEPKTISSIDNALNNVVQFEAGNYLVKDISNLNLGNGDYVGIALPKAMKLMEVGLKADSYEGIDIEYSLNGIEWNKAETSVKDNVLKTNSAVEATFIRVLNNSGKEVKLNIEKFEAKPVYKANPTISQNIGIYQNYGIENAIDGNLETKYWSDKGTGKGHYIQLDLGRNIPVYDINAYFNGQDYMRNSEFIISEDGVTWTSLGEMKYVDKDGKKLSSVNAEGKLARYVRLKANGENGGFWVQLAELQVNKSLPDGGDDIVSLVESNLKGNFSNLYDGDLSTAFEATDVKDGDNLVYKMTRVNNVKELNFLQDSGNISNAVVSVKDLNGKWSDIGTLDKQFTTLAVNKEILEVKLTFNSTNTSIKIYEIAIKEGVKDLAKFKGHLEIAVNEAQKIEESELDKVVPAVAKEFTEALREAEEILSNPNVTQKEVDDSFKRLSEVMHMLSFEKGNKESLVSLVGQIATLNSEDYIKATWDKLDIALNEANKIIANENAMEGEVSEAYSKLIKSFLDLRLKPSKDKLNDLINKASKLDGNKYTKNSWSVFARALKVANEVSENENATKDEVSNSEKSLELALANLELAQGNGSGDSNNGNTGGNGNTGNNGNNGATDNNSANTEISKEIASADTSGSTSGRKGNSSANKLPSTGGTSAAAVGLFGAITSLVGALIMKRKK